MEGDRHKGNEAKGVVRCFAMQESAPPPGRLKSEATNGIPGTIKKKRNNTERKSCTVLSCKKRHKENEVLRGVTCTSALRRGRREAKRPRVRGFAGVCKCWCWRFVGDA